MLEEHGIEVHGGEELERFEGSDGRVRKVVTKSGLELDCDLVVIGAGVTPDVMLARSAGLELGEAGGVRCSSRLETSAPGIYAAGDICEYDSPVHGRPIRVEHWDVAFNHGRTAALQHAGPRRRRTRRCRTSSPTSPTGPRWSTWARARASRSIRGSMDDGDFTAFYVDGGKVTAALTVGRSDDLEHARRFMKSGADGRPGARWRTRSHGPRVALAASTAGQGLEPR